MAANNAVTVILDLADYRGFISRFRAAVGVGVAADSSRPVIVQATTTRFYQFNVPDIYLSHVRIDRAEGAPVRGNYAQMGIPPGYVVTGPLVRQAFLQAAPSDGPARAVVILATAEAARSQVIYQVMQQVIHSGKSLPWATVEPLLHLWGEYKQHHHKRKPPVFGPLGERDYYPETDKEAAGAIQNLRAAGFLIDP